LSAATSATTGGEKSREASSYPKKPHFEDSELCPDALWQMLLNWQRQMGEATTIIPSTNNCCVGAVKRAMMIHGEDVNTLGNAGEYPITLAASRREPNNAVAIFKALRDHGACPNVIRADGQHLLALCRARAK
jgi:hypothetical protein